MSHRKPPLSAEAHGPRSATHLKALTASRQCGLREPHTTSPHHSLLASHGHSASLSHTIGARPRNHNHMSPRIVHMSPRIVHMSPRIPISHTQPHVPRIVTLTYTYPIPSPHPSFHEHSASLRSTSPHPACMSPREHGVSLPIPPPPHYPPLPPLADRQARSSQQQPFRAVH